MAAIGQGNMSDSLRRHRKNLVISNSVVFIVQIAEIELNKVINTPIVSLTVGDPSVLNYILWIVNFYYFIRYYQYWKVEPNKNFLSFIRKEF